MEEKGDLLAKVYDKRDRFFRWLGLGEDGIYLVAGGLSVLFIANTGAILGVDMLLSRKIPFALLVDRELCGHRPVQINKITAGGGEGCRRSCRRPRTCMGWWHWLRSASTRMYDPVAIRRWG